MTQIFLVRHGQSANNAGPDRERQPDPPLTAIGQRQAELTARWFSSSGIDRLYCSPFLRSLETTRPVADDTGLTPLVRIGLCEKGGCYSGHEESTKRGSPGMNRSQLTERYDGWDLDPEIDQHGWWKGDYEDWDLARVRAARIVDWMESELGGTDARALLVIHADFKRLLIEQILQRYVNVADTEFIGPLYNVGISHFSLEGGRWVLQTLNATGHLPTELVT